MAAFAVGALLGSVLLGGGPVWAYFTATAQAAGQTTSRSVAISQANFQNLNQTYRNTHSTLTQTGSFTVTNTGQANGQVSVSISGSGSFLSNLPIRVWPVASTGECTAGTAVSENAASGTWGSTTLSGTNLNAGASIIYCVRTTIDPHTQRPKIATPSGTQSAQSRLTATLSAAGWTVSTAATNTHKTEAIYPPATNYLPSSQSRWYTIRSGSNSSICLDAFGGKDHASLISWECGNGANQRWRIQPINYYDVKRNPHRKEDQTLVALLPRYLPFDRVVSVRNGVQILGLNNDSIAHHWWYVQKMAGDRYMLISHFNGTCLSVRSSPSDVIHKIVECTDPAAVLDLRREGLSYSSNGWTMKSSKEKPTGTIFFGSPAGSRFIMQYQDSTGKWINIAETDPKSDRIGIGGDTNIRDRTKIRFINRGSDEEVVWDGLTAHLDTKGGPTPYHYRLRISIAD